jgi:hypothetical protein
MGQRRRHDKTTAPQLTERQAYWLKQLRACDASGLTSSAYAKKHRLSIYALYQARRDHRRREALASSPKRAPVTFTKVRAAPSTAREGSWRIRFPNGAVIELEAPREPEDQVHLLQSVAGLS